MTRTEAVSRSARSPAWANPRNVDRCGAGPVGPRERRRRPTTAQRFVGPISPTGKGVVHHPDVRQKLFFARDPSMPLFLWLKTMSSAKIADRASKSGALKASNQTLNDCQLGLDLLIHGRLLTWLGSITQTASCSWSPTSTSSVTPARTRSPKRWSDTPISARISRLCWPSNGAAPRTLPPSMFREPSPPTPSPPTRDDRSW